MLPNLTINNERKYLYYANNMLIPLPAYIINSEHFINYEYEYIMLSINQMNRLQNWQIVYKKN